MAEKHCSSKLRWLIKAQKISGIEEADLFEVHDLLIIKSLNN